MDDCDFVQQLPMDWNAPSSPDAYGPPVLDDDLDAALHLAAAAAARFHGHGVVAGHAAVRLFGQRGVRRSADAAAAAPVMAAVLTNVRRDMVRLPILLLLLSPRSRLARLRSGDRGGGLPGEARAPDRCKVPVSLGLTIRMRGDAEHRSKVGKRVRPHHKFL